MSQSMRDAIKGQGGTLASNQNSPSLACLAVKPDGIDFCSTAKRHLVSRLWYASMAGRNGSTMCGRLDVTGQAVW